nr:unnamed protein product [Digitaria exilis]
MLTKLRQPLVPLPRRRLPPAAVVVAAAATAPLLVLLAVAAFSHSPVAVVTADGAPNLVELTLVAGAREKGAVCLDGSPPAYHLQRGFGSGSHSWLVYLSVSNMIDGTKLYYRGLRIWEAILDELMELGLAQANQNVRKVLPKDCLTKTKDPTECFFAAELIKSINTPTFILNSEYDSWQIGNVLAPNGSYPGQSWSSCKADIRNCSSKQFNALHGFRKKLVQDLKVAEGKSDWGLFIDSCFSHCQTPFNISWHSPISPRLGNKTIAEAVGDWYFGRSRGMKEIDCKYPCNPTCSSQLPTMIG